MVMFSSGSKHNQGKHLSNPLAGLGTMCLREMDNVPFEFTCGGAIDRLILLLRNNVED